MGPLQMGAPECLQHGTGNGDYTERGMHTLTSSSGKEKTLMMLRFVFFNSICSICLPKMGCMFFVRKVNLFCIVCISSQKKKQNF